VRIVDLTAELHSGLAVYPGDPPVVVEPATTVVTHGYAVARLALSDQSGTHVETQAHFLAHGRTMAAEPLDRLIGRASVVDVPCRVHHPNAIAHWRVTVVLPVVLTTQPYKPRRRRSYTTG